VPALIVAIIAAGFFRAGADVSLGMLLRWILWNGSLAAAGSLIALAHPLAILASFIGAPVATLSPFIGVGLFSGVAQAVMRRPRISDAETLVESFTSVKGIYKNRITHVLLVFFLSSIGGMIGNFVSIPSLAGILFNS
jgi:pheromone shutdown protein TraB